MQHNTLWYRALARKHAREDFSLQAFCQVLEQARAPWK